MLVRTQARGIELAMRTALGASPARLIRQLLAESTLLAACGGALGVALAVWGVDVLVRFAPEGLPRVDEIAIDGRLAAFAVVVTAAVAVGFGFWPAWRASRSPLNTAVHGNVRTTEGKERRRSQLLLVSSELALAQVLLVAAGLLVASFARLLSVNPGFDPRNLVTADVSLPGAKYGDPMMRIRFHEAVLERLAATPGVDAAAMAMQGPMRPSTITRGVWIEGRPDPPPGEFQLMKFITVSENYFAVTGVPILRGRGIGREDGVKSPDVVLVNEAFARRYFPGQDPINRRIGYGARSDPHYWRTIVGLVADTREQLGESPRPTAFAPFRQALEPWNFASYLVKTSLPLATVGHAIQEAVLASDSDQPVSRLRPVAADMRATIATEQFTTVIAATFAGLALVLAVVGTFGVMTQVVGGRTRELGVRMALGATRGRIIALVVGQAARVVVAAAIVGVGAALVLGRSIQALLYEVRPQDPATLSASALILIATALAASYIPIRRVLAKNPIASLRSE
jgi:putative ABC transport system permease protein